VSDVISCDGAAATTDNDDDSRQINAHFKDTHFPPPKAVILVKHTSSYFYRCTVHSKICVSSSLHRAFRRIILIMNQQMHYITFHIKIIKIAPTCFDPKIILRELRLARNNVVS